MPREHGKDGTYVETIALEDVLDVFDTVDGPVILSADVADELECSRETARRKLQHLYDRGDLARRKVSRRVVYWRATGFDTEGLRGDPETTLDDTAEPDARDAGESDPVETPRGEPKAESGRTRTESDTVDIDAAIDAVDTPGSGETLQRRRNALREMYEYLKEHGTARRSDFKEIVDAEDVGYGSFNSFWTNYVKAKDALKHLPNVDAPGEGEHTWRYTR